MTYVCPTCKGCGLVANDEAHSPWYDFLAAHPHYKDVSIPLDPADVGIDFRPVRCHTCGGEGRMEKLPVKGDMRVWAVRNPPARPDFFPASDVAMAKVVINALTASDLQAAWVQANVFGLEVFDGDDWSEWEDANGEDICGVMGFDREAD